MKIYTSLLAFAISSDGLCVLTDKADNPPSWVVPDSDRETLDIVRDGFYNISGIDKVFHPYYQQSLTCEFFANKHKEIYIIYSIYLPSVCELIDRGFQWTLLSNLNQDILLYNIIRYIYSSRK